MNQNIQNKFFRQNRVKKKGREKRFNHSCLSKLCSTLSTSYLLSRNSLQSTLNQLYNSIPRLTNQRSTQAFAHLHNNCRGVVFYADHLLQEVSGTQREKSGLILLFKDTNYLLPVISTYFRRLFSCYILVHFKIIQLLKEMCYFGPAFFESLSMT